MRSKRASLPERLDALWEAWVDAVPSVLPRLEMDESNVIDLDARRHSSYRSHLESSLVSSMRLRRVCAKVRRVVEGS